MADFSTARIRKFFIFSNDHFHANKYTTLAGIILIGLSFYSIGPIICNELNPGCSTGHYYTTLPIFLIVLGIGITLLMMDLKSIFLVIFSSVNR